MEIGAIGFQPYIYNTNSVGAASLNKIAAIPDDVTNHQIDYSELTEEENVNPLGRGQSASFIDILASQMSMGRSNASLVMSNNPFEATEEEQEQQAESQPAQTAPSSPVMEEMQQNVAEDVAADMMAGTNMSDMADASLYQRTQAINAYNMSMGIA